jgi:hypothetical protein
LFCQEINISYFNVLNYTIFKTKKTRCESKIRHTELHHTHIKTYKHNFFLFLFMIKSLNVAKDDSTCCKIPGFLYDLITYYVCFPLHLILSFILPFFSIRLIILFAMRPNTLHIISHYIKNTICNSLVKKNSFESYLFKRAEIERYL